MKILSLHLLRMPLCSLPSGAGVCFRLHHLTLWFIAVVLFQLLQEAICCQNNSEFSIQITSCEFILEEIHFLSFHLLSGSSGSFKLR